MSGLQGLNDSILPFEKIFTPKNNHPPFFSISCLNKDSLLLMEFSFSLVSLKICYPNSTWIARKTTITWIATKNGVRRENSIPLKDITNVNSLLENII